MKVKSNHVVIDVTKGRKKLKRAIEAGDEVAFVIVGYISGTNSIGDDDGVSREFTGTVTDIVVSGYGHNERNLSFFHPSEGDHRITYEGRK